MQCFSPLRVSLMVACSAVLGGWKGARLNKPFALDCDVARRERIPPAIVEIVGRCNQRVIRSTIRRLPHLSPGNPAAQALGYVDNTALVDNAKFPNHTKAQKCANCAFCGAKPGAAWGPCQLFPGFQVNTDGWCSAHKMKA